MHLRTAEETAVIVAEIFRRSQQNRARVSARTIRLASGRISLRASFLERLEDALMEFRIGLAELETGGFGVYYTSALSSAKPITAKKLCSPDELRALKDGKDPGLRDFQNAIEKDIEDAGGQGDE